MSHNKGVVQFFCMSLFILAIFASIIWYKRDLDDYLSQMAELEDTCRCRLESIQRIVNGRVETRSYMPWSVSITRTGYHHHCMGTIVSRYFVLTAQHCLNSSKAQFEVRVGLYELFDPQLKEKTYRVHQIIKFPDFSNASFTGDLALLKLRKPIRFEPGHVEPACLDLENHRFEPSQHSKSDGSTNNSTELTTTNQTVYVSTGFGTKQNVFFQNHKMVGKFVPSLVLKTAYFTEEDVAESDPDFGPLQDMFYNLNPINKGSVENPCLGDSGASLNLENKETGLTTVKGVASISVPIHVNETTIQFCKSNLIYTRLSYAHYRKFLNSILGDLRCRVELIKQRPENGPLAPV